MSNLYGTNVSATIKPFTTADIFPTHEAQYGKGGYRTVNSENDLTSIPADTNNSGVTRLETGMLVYVISTGKIYKYTGDTTTNTSSDWEEFTVTAENEYYKVVADTTAMNALTSTALVGTLAYVIYTDEIYKFTSDRNWVLVEGEITPVENEYYKVVASLSILTNVLIGTLAYVTTEDEIYKYTSDGWRKLELYYVYNFSNQNSSFTITHNLGKYPSVTIVDSDKYKIYGDIKYLNENQIEITFSTPTNISGVVYLN